MLFSIEGLCQAMSKTSMKSSMGGGFSNFTPLDINLSDFSLIFYM